MASSSTVDKHGYTDDDRYFESDESNASVLLGLLNDNEDQEEGNISVVSPGSFEALYAFEVRLYTIAAETCAEYEANVENVCHAVFISALGTYEMSHQKDDF